jgi:hypothetical protein
MNRNITLTVTSLLTILLFTLHFADDIARGIEPGGTSNYTGVVIAAVYLYATLALADRRTGLVLMLLGAIGSAGVPYIHMKGAGLLGPRVVAHEGGILLWVWTLTALGATGLVSTVLTARELWRLRRG